jgi:hypothetical protein
MAAPWLLEESDPAGVILYVMAGTYCLPFPYRGALTGAAQLLFSKCTLSYVMSYATQGKHGLVL